MTVCQRDPKTNRNAVVMQEPMNRLAINLREWHGVTGPRFLTEDLARNNESEEKTSNNSQKWVLVQTWYVQWVETVRAGRETQKVRVHQGGRRAVQTFAS